MPTAEDAVDQSAYNSDALHHPVKTAVRSSERLRILYNAVMFVAGLGVIWYLRGKSGEYSESARHAVHTGHLLFVVIFGIAFNVFYCFGPLVESYWCIFRGRPSARLRVILFVAGLMLSLVVMAYWTLMAHRRLLTVP